MIPVAQEPRQSEDWQRALREAIRDPLELLRGLGLAASPLAQKLDAGAAFKLRVPQPFISRMKHGDADDPLLRQVLTSTAEQAVVSGFSADPLGESAASPAPGLLQKYHGRALLMASPVCAVHCRYCFRRSFPYHEHTDSAALAGALAQLRVDTSISEVILSGGDPLMLKDPALVTLLEALTSIPHVRRLRIHTRTPVVIPQRVTSALCAGFAAQRLPVTVVLHMNHGNEIDNELRVAIRRLKETGVTLLNQSVLLKGVNDDAAALCTLSERMHECGVLPYYLHLLDPVQGTAHFQVADKVAVRLVAEMRNLLPGYLVPRLVRELAGQPAKQVVA